jgi:hypothetical protein
VFLLHFTNIASEKEAPMLRIKQTQMKYSDRQILVASASYKVNVLIEKLHLECNQCIHSDEKLPVFS